MTGPTITRIYETVIYGADVESMKGFYADNLGVRLVEGPDELSAAFRLPDGAVLLIFDPARSSEPGRAVPSHGAIGRGHIAFTVPRGDLARWRTRLGELAIPVEREVEWGGGQRSLYVRDPAGNSVELTEDELWAK